MSEGDREQERERERARERESERVRERETESKGRGGVAKLNNMALTPNINTLLIITGANHEINCANRRNRPNREREEE